jgi:hypothetical protein
MVQSPCFLLPLLIPLCPLSLFPLLTWNPPSCDRIRPPWSQVTRKLTSPFSTHSHSLPTPNSQVNKRLTMTTSRIRLLLSGTVTRKSLHYAVIRLQFQTEIQYSSHAHHIKHKKHFNRADIYIDKQSIYMVQVSI